MFFTAPGKKVGLYKGNPANLPLGDHYQIQLDVGTPIVKPGQRHQLGQPLDPVDCDAVVVGLGPGGEEVAGKLAEAGLDVVGIEAELVGGECPYWGCIPSKMMVRAADLLAEGRRIPGNAGSSVITPDWAPVARRIRDEATDSWDDKVAVDRFVGKGGQFIRAGLG